MGNYYQISTEEEQGSKWRTLSKKKAAEVLGGLTTSRIETLDDNVFQHVSKYIRTYASQ